MPAGMISTTNLPRSSPRSPRLPLALLRALLPYAERDEVIADLAAEHAERAAARGRLSAALWLWWQVSGSVLPLVRRNVWRGWSGFEPDASRMRPGGPSMESWIMDLRYAARRLRSRPMYALLVILTLALGVGGTASIFGIVRGLLLDPLPYKDEEQVSVFWNTFDWSEAEFLFFRPNFPGFQKVAAYRPDDVTIQQGDEAVRLVTGLRSSAELFDVLGARPLIGRGFQEGDDQLGNELTAVLSYGLWQELGGDPSIIGQRLRLDGFERTIVGVMPRGFWFPSPAVRIWLPVQLDARRGAGQYALIGRRAPGATEATIAASLKQLTTALGERFQYPEQWDKTKNAKLTPVREFLLGGVRLPLLATLAAMAVILLIACANVAALMLGQVEGRTSELAVRAALGASRRRLTQQLLGEALLVGILAGGVGALLAWRGFGLLASMLPLGALAEGAEANWTLFAAAMAIAILASLAIAMAPVSFLGKGQLQSAITRARTSGVGGRGRVESGLVIAEVALAVLLAAGAGLLIRSVANLRSIDPGVDTQGIAVVDIAMTPNMTMQDRGRVIRELVPALEAAPGVRSAAAVQRMLLRGGGDSWGMEVEGRPDLPPSTTFFRIVTPDYFRTLGIRFVSGRGFEPGDRADGEPVTIVNQALAKKYFGTEDPIGRRIANGFGAFARIVGVVENIAEAKLTDEPQPARYILADQAPYWPEASTLVIAMRPGQDESAVLGSARSVIARVAPGVAVQNATTMPAVFSQAIGPARQVMTLLTLLTALALVLGAIGIYGVTSQFVNRRKRDWSIRLALGLTPSRVIAQVVSGGTRLVVAGAVIGIIAVLALTRLLSALLFGVGATDPWALGLAIASLLAVGVMAAYVPAWRASRADPALALREQ